MSVREEDELFGQEVPEGLTGSMWTWFRTDWVEVTTGEYLTGHEPTARLKKLWSIGEEGEA